MNECSVNTNPYASPQCDLPPRVGVWQDGELLVMHINATLPSICVKSGKRAEHYSDITIRWVQNFVPWHVTIKVPLTWAAFRAAMLVPVAAFTGTLVVTVALVGALSLYRDGNEPILLVLLIAVMAIVTICMGFRALNAIGKVLRVSRSRGEYLWLAGAGTHFLHQLPQWEE
jgi:hypothetical protein